MTTWTQLQTDFPLWNKRTDQTARLSGFVALAEARFNRRLRVRQQEAALSGTTDDDGLLTLPADFLAPKTLWVPNYEADPLDAQSLDYIKASQQLGQRPTAYAVGQSDITFNGTGDVEGVYFASVPGLVANGSNWLSLMAYDAYLFGALAEAAFDAMDDPERATGLYARADAVISELINNDRRDRFSGPLVSRKR